MSPKIDVDEHLAHDEVTIALKHWITAEQIGVELSQARGRSDDSLITLLRSLKRRTFITIDDWFYQRRLCDNAYCIIYFHVTTEKQAQIPTLLRRLFIIPGFSTIRERMGKVVRVSEESIKKREVLKSA